MSDRLEHLVLEGEVIGEPSDISEVTEMDKVSSCGRYITRNGQKFYAKSGKPVGRPQGAKTRSLMNLKGLTPKGFLLRVMADEKASDDKRFRAAIAVAPYCHPKLQAVQNLNIDVQAQTREDIEAQLREHGLDPETVFNETLALIK